MKRCIVLFLLICSFIGCGTSSTKLLEMEKEYESILTSDLSRKELVMMMTNFVLNNPSHFDSKVDLGGFYMMTDYEKARDYLKRAEGVVENAPKTDKGEKSVFQLYAYLAQVEFNIGSFAEAERYAKKAIETHSEYGEVVYYLLGQIQLVQGKLEEALKSYDFAFSTLPEEAVPENLHAYMYLLADAERFTECIPILERYFETGEYFSGLGAFASGVYTKTGELEKELLSIFFEYEFNSNYTGHADDAVFMSGLDDAETFLQSNGTDAIGVPVLQLIRSVYDKDIIVEDTFSSFFVARYCILIRKIMDNTLTFEDFEEYLSLEKYFRKFSVYYWNGWTMAKMLDLAELPKYTMMLEKIIGLDQDAFSPNKAKHELGALIGLDESASESILTEQEVQLIVFVYAQTGEHELFDRIYSLLELPDNSYVTHAMEYLKDNREEYVDENPIEYAGFYEQKYGFLEDILSAKLQTADGRLRERLEYILE